LARGRAVSTILGSLAFAIVGLLSAWLAPRAAGADASLVAPIIALFLCYGFGMAVWQGTTMAVFAERFADDPPVGFATLKLHSGLGSALAFAGFDRIGPVAAGYVCAAWAVLGGACYLLLPPPRHAAGSGEGKGSDADEASGEGLGEGSGPEGATAPRAKRQTDLAVAEALSDAQLRTLDGVQLQTLGPGAGRSSTQARGPAAAAPAGAGDDAADVAASMEGGRGVGHSTGGGAPLEAACSAHGGAGPAASASGEGEGTDAAPQPTVSWIKHAMARRKHMVRILT
jgi:hypothetical protein